MWNRHHGPVRSRGKRLVGGLALLAALALLGLWLIPFHHGAQYCGSLLRPAPGLSDADPCTAAIDDRGSILGLALLVLAFAALGASLCVVCGRLIRRLRGGGAL